MKRKVFLKISGMFLLLFLLIFLFIYQIRNSIMGLKPIATYKQYRIFGIIGQKGLPCAEAIEILDSDEKYEYYFPCLKSHKIYFISDEEKILVKEAYDRKIITKEELFELGIVNRMVKVNE